ncbi:SpoIIE family protein phosphatase [Pseudodesulfovibrio pelocollis]|uniref:SpoIIE family protein phosphatase n=1 Tax=Pseudodesulfovibrio pelocollis TaxID=3051432 RepID=UPI00255A8DF5|nr:SpoIIE family protein phosphatase [Pseudodesulfovibrio sp. SB368]
MKLSLRVKIFVVLIAFSLLPLLISRTVTGRTARNMAATLSEGTRTELLAIVTAELEHSAVTTQRLIESRGAGLRLGAMTLARQAGPLLGDVGVATGQDIPASERHRVRMGGRTMLADANATLPPPDFDTISVHVPPLAQVAGTQEQAARLADLLPVFRDIHASLAPGVTWARVGLESGLLLRYPGLDSFPRGYDPRDQDWYRSVRQSLRPEWTVPQADPTTRQVMAVIGCPVFDAAGRFAGVAALDVPIQSVLHETDLKLRWSDAIRSYMVAPDGEGGLRILAQQSYENPGRHWHMGIERERMTSDDPEAFARLLALMSETQSGAMRLPHSGEDSVWAFASGQNYSFLLIAPESVVSRLPDEVSGSLAAMFERIRSMSAVISGFMLMATALLAWFGSRAITRPIVNVAEAAGRLAGGDFSTRVHGPRTGDERDVLADAFNDMVPRLAEQMRLSRDLALAEEVQRLLLPGHPPTLPGYDLAGGIVYCDQTGGDYYDFIEVRTESGRALAVVLGDVSGHGVASALIMASVRGQLHSLADMPMTAGERLTAINASLARDLDGTGRFLTLFYLELLDDAGSVRWVRAGHDPAIRHLPGADHSGELGGEGLPLGVLEETAYAEGHTRLEPGEVLVLATDGVWEARDGKGRMFGKKRMLALIRENAHNSAQSIRDALMDAVDAHQGGVREDDTAVVVVRRTGSAAAPEDRAGTTTGNARGNA